MWDHSETPAPPAPVSLVVVHNPLLVGAVFFSTSNVFMRGAATFAANNALGRGGDSLGGVELRQAAWSSEVLNALYPKGR